MKAHKSNVIGNRIRNCRAAAAFGVALLLAGCSSREVNAVSGAGQPPNDTIESIEVPPEKRLGYEADPLNAWLLQHPDKRFKSLRGMGDGAGNLYGFEVETEASGNVRQLCERIGVRSDAVALFGAAALQQWYVIHPNTETVSTSVNTVEPAPTAGYVLCWTPTTN